MLLIHSWRYDTARVSLHGQIQGIIYVRQMDRGMKLSRWHKHRACNRLQCQQDTENIGAERVVCSQLERGCTYIWTFLYYASTPLCAFMAWRLKHKGNLHFNLVTDPFSGGWNVPDSTHSVSWKWQGNKISVSLFHFACCYHATPRTTTIILTQFMTTRSQTLFQVLL